jgi:hypothetical protein
VGKGAQAAGGLKGMAKGMPEVEDRPGVPGSGRFPGVRLNDAALKGGRAGYAGGKFFPAFL